MIISKRGRPAGFTHHPKTRRKIAKALKEYHAHRVATSRKVAYESPKKGKVAVEGFERLVVKKTAAKTTPAVTDKGLKSVRKAILKRGGKKSVSLQKTQSVRRPKVI
jgi:hypothetical protein